jgi:hypothetical protein
MIHTLIFGALVVGLAVLVWWAWHTVPLRDLAAAPGRWRRWRRAARQFRRAGGLTPAPQPGQPGYDELVYFRSLRVRQPGEIRSRRRRIA